MTIGIPPAESKNFGAKMREFALVALGLTNNKLDAFVTLRDLKDAGVINVRQTFSGGTGGTGAGSNSGSGGTRPVIVEPALDLTPPPPPGGFIATGGTTQILFETAAPVYRQGHGHARTKIYAAAVTGGPLPTFADAVLYTDFPGNIGLAPFDPASSLRLWATWTSVDGAESAPAGGINGVAAATGLLEDQHIANLAVGKLLAGSLSIGQYIQSADYVASTSGWRIQTLPGGGAFMEINGGATIGGLQVFADHIRSSNYIANTQGYRLKSDGTGQIGGVLITLDGVQSSNYVAGTTGFRWQFNGALEASSATLNNGTLIAGLIRNPPDTVRFDLNATGSSLMLRAGALQTFGFAGNHYPVEINADGSGFFGRGIVSGGKVLAFSPVGDYAIPADERPGIIFYTVAPPYSDPGGAGP